MRFTDSTGHGTSPPDREELQAAAAISRAPQTLKILASS
jgi:hypothetical protein